MQAWRSFLRRRPNPLITSRLQPVRRHDATHAALPCRNLITASSRRHISGGATINGDSYAEEAPASEQDRQLGRTADQQHRWPAAAKRHLYLVLDDHRHEYGIYKLDLDADAYAADDEEVGSDSARPLPHPAVFRLEVPTDTARFHALGSCILTTGSIPDELGICREHCNRGVVTYLYDTATPALSVACDIPEGLSDGYHHAVAVGGRLYAFEMETEASGSMQCMRTDGRDDDRKAWRACSSRCFWGAHPVEPPFYVSAITALAVHPSGRAFFVSASEGRRGDVRTYSYDTASGQWVSSRGGWRWELPFVGHAGYDRELDAWVGLHMDEDCLYETDGHLCACRVPLPSTEQRAPLWTVGEKMLLEHPDWCHVDAKLVHMPERGEYCLVERLRREGTNQKECLADGDECLLRLTSFRLKYPEDGDLVMAVEHTRSYRVSRYRDDFEVGAFWI